MAKMLAICSSCESWLLLAGESRELGDGFWRAWVRSLAAISARSVEDALGVST
jgi:hypothetical protein